MRSRRSFTPKIPLGSQDGRPAGFGREPPANQPAADAREFQRTASGATGSRVSPARRGRIVPMVVLALIIAGAAAGALIWMRPGASPGTASPSVAEEIDRLAAATTVASRAAFTGSCRPAGLAFAFDVKGDVTSYANATRTLVAQPVKPQDVFASNNYEPPPAISLDGAWWEVSGRKAGRITLAGSGEDARTRAPLAFTCDVDLPAAT
jgi:hypothetical protein